MANPRSPGGGPVEILEDLTGESFLSRAEWESWWSSQPSILTVEILLGEVYISRVGKRLWSRTRLYQQEVVRIRDVSNFRESKEYSVESHGVSRIRTGHHEEPTGTEVHLAFDLTGSEVTIKSIDVVDERILRIRFETDGCLSP